MPLSKITAASISDGTVVAADIANGAITGPKLGLTSINANNIVTGAVTGDKLGATSINANNIVGGTITTTQIASNTISNTNIAAGAIENYSRATGILSGMRNRIINGAMVIDQRNAGASVTASSAYTLDRWICYTSQASKFTAQQNAGSVTPPAGFSNYLGVTSSSAYSVGSTDFFSIEQPIEGFNAADLAWGTANAKTVTLSFWVRSSLTGTFGGAFYAGTGTLGYAFSYTISAANTWEYKTVTITGPTTGTWASNNTSFGSLCFGLGIGSSYSWATGSWLSQVVRSATGATSVVGTNGATFYITGVQLEVGSTATSFDYRPYGTELQLCQRYYQFYDAGLVSGTTSGTSYGVSATCTVVPRTTPTVSWVSPTLGVNGFPTTSPNMTDIKAYSCLVWMTANATQSASSWQNRVAFSAEL